MKKMSQVFLGCSALILVSVAANAAGTYYTGNTYQGSQQANYNPQPGGYIAPPIQYANSSAFSQGQMQNQGYQRSNQSSVRYNVGGRGMASQTAQPQQISGQTNRGSSSVSLRPQSGLVVGAGLSRDVAMWQFEMKDSGSILHYDNIDWNVFDVNASYYFLAGNTRMQVDAGLDYGMQAGETTMVDDDITDGGYLITEWFDTGNQLIGAEMGHTVSLGTSKDGDMLGLHAGLGLTDFFKIGGLKITPSVGYRYLKYKLNTTNNYGISFNSAACFETVDGEIQCDPAIIAYDPSTGKESILWRANNSTPMFTTYNYINTGDSYYFEQAGTSHSYEVQWSGPYLALDMVYDINQTNMVNARVELGLPSYTAEGDQPYRFDWAHPKSVEDTAGFGDAFHIGLGANWSTALTDSLSLSVGVTYDYYNVDGASAKTYLNGGYYNDLYNTAVTIWENSGYSESNMLDPTFVPAPGNVYELQAYRDIALNVIDLQRQCSGWTCETDDEIKSFYKSLGVRVGFNAKF